MGQSEDGASFLADMVIQQATRARDLLTGA
jgi:hypothetical protein